MPRRHPRLNPHRIIHNIKFWAIEIAVLLVFLKWLGGALWHDLGLPDFLPTTNHASLSLIKPDSGEVGKKP